jgi:hypothetical protein
LAAFVVDAPQNHVVCVTTLFAIHRSRSHQTPNDQVHRARATAPREAMKLSCAGSGATASWAARADNQTALLRPLFIFVRV